MWSTAEVLALVFTIETSSRWKWMGERLKVCKREGEGISDVMGM
jgi:hypothetical protein